MQGLNYEKSTCNRTIRVSKKKILRFVIINVKIGNNSRRFGIRMDYVDKNGLSMDCGKRMSNDLNAIPLSDYFELLRITRFINCGYFDKTASSSLKIS